MRCQGRNGDLDGLSEQDRARLDAAARASVTPGLEGLAAGGTIPKAKPVIVPAGTVLQPIKSTDPLPGKPAARKRGHRA